MILNVRMLLPNRQRSTLVGEVYGLRKKLGIDRRLGQTGVHRSEIPELARKAMKDPCLVTNLHGPSQRDVEVIFEQAL